MSKNSVLIESILDSENRCAVDCFATEANVTYEEALNHIIRQWNDKINSHLSDKPELNSPLDALAGKIETIDRELDEIILKMKRASL